MKQFKFLLYLFLLTCHFAFSQEQSDKINGIFYKISLATTLTINEDYVAFDDDDSSTLLEPSALFVNNTIGYQFDNRTSIGLNFEYNWHSKQGLHFFPTYLSLQHNIIAKDTNLFIFTRRLWNTFRHGEIF